MLFDPDSACLPLLEDFFSGDSLDETEAWTTGRVVDDDAEVRTALRAARGAQPVKALSAVYRGVARSAMTQRLWAGGGTPDDGV
jgi:hypothetical protein